jgi:hypothetical protein
MLGYGVQMVEGRGRWPGQADTLTWPFARLPSAGRQASVGRFVKRGLSGAVKSEASDAVPQGTCGPRCPAIGDLCRPGIPSAKRNSVRPLLRCWPRLQLAL